MAWGRETQALQEANQVVHQSLQELRTLDKMVRNVRGDSSSTRAYGGMGLAIVSNLISQMGGELQVQSALAQGSTFRFTLPLSR